jgi:hypothetical protein
MKICTPVYYFIILNVIIAIWYYIYFSKYFMKNPYIFLLDLFSSVSFTLIIAWCMQCMCYGKCKNTVWTIFIFFAIVMALGWSIMVRYKITDPYAKINF